MNKEKFPVSEGQAGSEQEEARFTEGLASRVERLQRSSPRIRALLMAALVFAGGEQASAFDLKSVVQNAATEAGWQAGEEVRSGVERKRLSAEFARAEKQRNEAFFKLAGYDADALSIWLAEQEDAVSVQFGPEYGQQVQELLEEQRAISSALADAEVAIAGLEFDAAGEDSPPRELEKKQKERGELEAALDRIEHQLNEAQEKLGAVEERSLESFRNIQESRLKALRDHMKNMTPTALDAVTEPLRAKLYEADAKMGNYLQQMDWERERIGMERANTAGRVGTQVTQETIDKVLGH